MGFDVLLVGRKLPGSKPVKRQYSTKRMRLIFNKGPLFYAEYNLRLFVLILLTKSNILLSNDLDSLAANYIASRLKKNVLVYDSHEYFTEVPELIDRPKTKAIWEWLEKKMLPKIRHAYTVCNSIAHTYNLKYGTNFKVVRNLPTANNFQKKAAKASSKKMVLYQGALNIGRGLEQAIRAMHYIENAELVIAGDGDIRKELETLVKNENLEKKVRFLGRLPLEELSLFTVQADLGLSIEEDLGLNYRYALPNKLFDYVQAKVPVLVSNLPEMAAIVKNYKIGAITETLEPKQLAVTISNALTNDENRKLWNNNLGKAAIELTWENEEKVLKSIFQQLL